MKRFIIIFILLFTVNCYASPELVVNGDFTSDASGWTATASSLASVAGGQSGNCLEITLSGAGVGYASQIIPTSIGTNYTFSIWNKNGTSPNGQIKIGNSFDDTTNYYSGVLANAGWTQYTGTFNATTTTTYITLVNLDATPGTTELFDIVSVQQTFSSGRSFSVAIN